MLLVRRYPIVEGIVKLIQNHPMRKRLNDHISARHVQFKTKVVPEIVDHYVNQINRFEGQLLLMDTVRQLSKHLSI